MTTEPKNFVDILCEFLKSNETKSVGQLVREIEEQRRTLLASGESSTEESPLRGILDLQTQFEALLTENSQLRQDLESPSSSSPRRQSSGSAAPRVHSTSTASLDDISLQFAESVTTTPLTTQHEYPFTRKESLKRVNSYGMSERDSEDDHSAKHRRGNPDQRVESTIPAVNPTEESSTTAAVVTPTKDSPLKQDSNQPSVSEPSTPPTTRPEFTGTTTPATAAPETPSTNNNRPRKNLMNSMEKAENENAAFKRPKRDGEQSSSVAFSPLIQSESALPAFSTSSSHTPSPPPYDLLPPPIIQSVTTVDPTAATRASGAVGSAGANGFNATLSVTPTARGGSGSVVEEETFVVVNNSNNRNEQNEQEEEEERELSTHEQEEEAHDNSDEFVDVQTAEDIERMIMQIQEAGGSIPDLEEIQQLLSAAKSIAKQQKDSPRAPLPSVTTATTGGEYRDTEREDEGTAKESSNFALSPNVVRALRTTTDEAEEGDSDREEEEEERVTNNNDQDQEESTPPPLPSMYYSNTTDRMSLEDNANEHYKLEQQMRELGIAEGVRRNPLCHLISQQEEEELQSAGDESEQQQQEEEEGEEEEWSDDDDLGYRRVVIVPDRDMMEMFDFSDMDPSDDPTSTQQQQNGMGGPTSSSDELLSAEEYQQMLMYQAQQEAMAQDGESQQRDAVFDIISGDPQFSQQQQQHDQLLQSSGDLSQEYVGMNISNTPSHQTASLSSPIVHSMTPLSPHTVEMSPVANNTDSSSDTSSDGDSDNDQETSFMIPTPSNSNHHNQPNNLPLMSTPILNSSTSSGVEVEVEVENPSSLNGSADVAPMVMATPSRKTMVLDANTPITPPPSSDVLTSTIVTPTVEPIPPLQQPTPPNPFALPHESSQQLNTPPPPAFDLESLPLSQIGITSPTLGGSNQAPSAFPTLPDTISPRNQNQENSLDQDLAFSTSVSLSLNNTAMTSSSGFSAERAAESNQNNSALLSEAESEAEIPEAELSGVGVDQPMEGSQLMQQSQQLQQQGGEEGGAGGYGLSLEQIESMYDSFDLKVIYEKDKTGFEENKDFPIRIHSIIAGRYQILEYLGSAAFSRAVQCLDLRTGEMVCIKIIKNNKDFFDQSLDEIKLLQFINKSGDPDSNHCVKLHDYFYYKEHLFLVCELLRDNLYEFSKYNRESGEELYFNIPRLQRITRQILKALAFVHNLNLIHCDLKPENILIKSYSRCEVKVIDFGSSCYTTDHLSSYVQSRSYRAPEVILGLPYDQKIDVWSVGCILAELWTGRVLFHNDSVQSMIARIVAIMGMFDREVLSRGRHVFRIFTKNFIVYERNKKNGTVALLYPKKTSLKKRLHCDDDLFVDFIGQCLQTNPRNRPTSAQALQHPWLQVDYGYF